MKNIRDFRPGAIQLAKLKNAEVQANGGEPVIDEWNTCSLHQPVYESSRGGEGDEFVYLHCGDMTYVVFRDVVVSGSMYFEAALFGFFKETHCQEITFDEDEIRPDILDFYLDLAHRWFFEIKVLGTKVVPGSIYNLLIDTYQEAPFLRDGVKMPDISLTKMAEAIILADRFMHRPLLCLLRQLFINLLNHTQDCWKDILDKTRKWSAYFHVNFMRDYVLAFHALSGGHDDMKFLKSALIESFYFFSLYIPTIEKHFSSILSPAFVEAWKADIERPLKHPMIMREHAMGLFKTDQLFYACKTRKEKDARWRRVMNICSPELRTKFLPWHIAPEEKRIRVTRLREVIAVLRLQRFGVCEFIPGALSHDSPEVKSDGNQKEGKGGKGKRRKNRNSNKKRKQVQDQEQDQQQRATSQDIDAYFESLPAEPTLSAVNANSYNDNFPALGGAVNANFAGNNSQSCVSTEPAGPSGSAQAITSGDNQATNDSSQSNRGGRRRGRRRGRYVT